MKLPTAVLDVCQNQDLIDGFIYTQGASGSGENEATNGPSSDRRINAFGTPELVIFTLLSQPEGLGEHP